jgi:NAD(P)-dependent dehydrogenase (short-subunit alcohol dehydrogenase family)
LARLRLRGRVVVVTGAARGIGRATALCFAAERAKLALCDIDAAGLSETEAACRTAGVETLAQVVDVGDAGAVASFAERVERELGETLCLVNNAGVGVSGGFFATEPEDWEWLLRVNLWGAIHCVRSFAPAMRRRKAGRIVNVASASGYCNLPQLAAYGTTKYALIGLSEALRAELLPDGVKVSVVCPGFVMNGMLERARIRGVADAEAERDRLRQFYQERGHTPEIVARAIVLAAESGRALVPVTSEAVLLYWLKRLAPSAVPWVLRLAERVR